MPTSNVPFFLLFITIFRAMLRCNVVSYKKLFSNGYKKVRKSLAFYYSVIHAEPPFSCNYAKSRNGCYDI